MTCPPPEPATPPEYAMGATAGDCGGVWGGGTATGAAASLARPDADREGGTRGGIGFRDIIFLLWISPRLNSNGGHLRRRFHRHRRQRRRRLPRSPRRSLPPSAAPPRSPWPSRPGPLPVPPG